MIYAQITGGIIRKCIVLDDPSILSLFAVGYDSIIRIDNITPRPSIGWSYDGVGFWPPTSPYRLAVKGKILNAMDFGRDLVADFAARNVEVNLNIAQVQYIMDKTAEVKVALEAGSLYVALDLMSKLEPEPLLPQDVINYYSDRIKRYLGLK